MRVIVLVIASGCGAEPGTLLTTPREVITDTLILQPQALVEVTMTGGPGDAAFLAIDASAVKLDWNIHASGSTQEIESKLGVIAIRYDFEPPEDGDWNLVLRNTDEGELTLQLNVELYGDLTWTE